MEKLKTTLNLKCYKSVGFYFSAVAAILGIAAAAVYGAGFQKETLSSYYSAVGVILPVLGAIAYLLLVAFKKTSQYAPVVLWLFVFAGLLAFVSKVYMYLSGVFYNGVSADTIAMIDPAFMGCAVLLILACVIGNAGIYLRQTEKIRTKDDADDEDKDKI